jgi:hypothetical protein
VRTLALLLLAAAAGCGKRGAANYRNCLKLRVGMGREEMLAVMGPPDETIPYVEGKSLPHLAGRTAYEWANAATMPGPDHVDVRDATGRVDSVRCANVVLNAEALKDPPLARP